MMRSIVIVMCIAAAFGGPIAATYNPDCVTVPTPTVTWNVTCRNLTNAADNCWSPRVPTATDVVLFPNGTQATVDAIWPTEIFGIWLLDSIIVAPEAKLTMHGGAISVTRCLIVEGTLELAVPTYNQSVSQSNSTPTSLFLEDPGQPEGTDCKLIEIGFTPRICGPGHLRVGGKGVVKSHGLYTSLFISIFIDESAVLTVREGAFVWGNVSNNGVYNASGFVYQHGFVFNYATAYMETVVFDKWARTFVESPPILIENHGHVTFTDNLIATDSLYPDNSTGVYRATLVNFATVDIVIGVAGTLMAGTEFDIFNVGMITWSNSGTNWYYSYQGQGNVINKGTFVANQAQVYLSMYHSIGGTLVTENGGQFSFGNGAINPQHIKLCQQRQREETRKRRDPVVEKAVKDEDRNCWWYGGFCYPFAYDGVWKAPVVKPVAPSKPRGVRIDLSHAIKGLSTPSLCSNRYGMVNSFIRGDGTGSVISTAAIEVKGTLRIEAGGRWYAMTEHHMSPVWGGGSVVVAKDAVAYLGIEADFNHPGKLTVVEGGMIAIPRHARVTFSNHTLSLAPGSIIHVDGVLESTMHNDRVLHCGELRGIGRILKGKDDDFRCPAVDLQLGN